MMSRCVRASGAVFLLTAAAGILRAGEIAPAFRLEDIAIEDCRAFVDGEEAGRASRAALATALFGAPGTDVWTTGKRVERQRHLVVAFTHPVAIGTVCAPDFPGAVKQPLQPPAGSFVSMLRPDARYPGDPTNEADWILLRPGAVKYLPVGASTRSLRFSEILPRPLPARAARESTLPRVVCLRDRFYDANDLGSVSRFRDDGGGERVIASWLEPLPVAGLLLHGAVELQGAASAKLRVHSLAAGCTLPPPRATAGDWQAATVESGAGLLVFSPPVTTRAIQVTMPPVNRQSAVLGMLPLISLGQEERSPGAHAPPPFKVPFTMPLSGFAAIDIHDRNSGALVRRLIAETPRERGPVEEPWDLRDNGGQLVPPGEYTWRGLAVPPLNRIYELTLYNAGQPPWPARPPHGKGGGMWLANHGQPGCVAAQPDMMWLGSFVVESGHGMIATDLEGNKLWGTASFSSGFRGPSRIAVDDACAYGLTNSLAYRVDPRRDFKARSVFTIASTAERPWNVGKTEPHPERGGLAARDGRLYVAINLPDQWLTSSFIANALNPTDSEPSVRLYKNRGRKRENEQVDKVYGFGRYDELMSFYAAFMLDRMPKETLSYPNVPLTCNGDAFFGDAPSAGANRDRLVAVFHEPVAVGSILIPDGGIKVQALKAGVAVSRAVTSAQKTLADAGRLSAEAADGDGALGDFIEELDDAGGGAAGGGESDEGIWQTLKNVGGAGRPTVALVPEGGLKTQALRFKAKRLPFTQVMARRLADVTPDAERISTEGRPTPQGGFGSRGAEGSA